MVNINVEYLTANLLRHFNVVCQWVTVYIGTEQIMGSCCPLVDMTCMHYDYHCRTSIAGFKVYYAGFVGPAIKVGPTEREKCWSNDLVNGTGKNKAVNQRNKRLPIVVTLLSTNKYTNSSARKCSTARLRVDAEHHPVHCGLSALPSVKQTHRSAALYISMTEWGAEKDGQQCHLAGTL